MAKLAIVEDREEDKYEHITTLKCWTCDGVSGKELRDAPDSKVLRSIRLEIIET